MKKTILTGLLTATSIYATPIKSISYNGLEHLSHDIATSITGLEIGDDLNEENSNQAILNLYKQGYFKDIYIDENNGDVTINVVEKPTVAKIDIEGVVTNDKKVINQIIGIQTGQMYDEVALERAKERVKQFYDSRSFFDTVVDVDVIPFNKNSVQLKIVVNRGEKIIINKVQLVGAKKFNYSDIANYVENRQEETLGWLWGFNDGSVKIYELDNDTNRIRDRYLKYGYIDANVSAPFLDTSFDNYTTNLSYYINEGQVYKVKSISIDAPEFLELNTDKIMKQFKLKEGKTANILWLRDDLAQIENIVADKGYAYVKVEPNITKNKDFTADIKYTIIPNEKVYIRNIVISGNSKTAYNVIRRDLQITEGQLYNKTGISHTKDALKRTGYFEDVNIIEKRVNDQQIDLEVAIKEAQTGSITGSVGYGTGDGITLSGSVSNSNIFGTGYKSALSVNRSEKEFAGSISLINPRVLDSAYSLGGSLFANRYDFDDYKQQSYGFNITAGRNIGEYTNIYLTYELQRSKISGLDAFYRQAGYLNGLSYKSSITPGISYNSTDDYILPRRGLIASTSFEYAGIGGDLNFLKNTSIFNYYYGFQDDIDYDLIFRYKFRFNYIWNKDPSKLPINEKVFLGGIRSLRGFEYRSVTPRTPICRPTGDDGKVIDSCKNIDTGGKIAMTNSIELSFPLIQRVKMRGLAFIDYGMVGQTKLNEMSRLSAGIGIEWQTPIGPLQIFYSRPLNNKEGDKVERFQFNIGARF